MNPLKSHLLNIALATFFILSGPSVMAGTVGHVENAGAGQFLSSAGIALTAGGVTVGFFAVAVPTAADWVAIATQSVASAYTRLTSSEFGYTDIRTVSGTTIVAGLDWNFPLPLSGTIQNLSPTLLPQGVNTQLFLLAFNNGTWNANASLSFLSATEWAALAATNWLPTDLGTTTLLLSNVDTASEIKVGTDSGPLAADVNVKLAAPVPEPSTAILLGAGILGLFALRRRTFRA